MWLPVKSHMCCNWDMNAFIFSEDKKKIGVRHPVKGTSVLWHGKEEGAVGIGNDVFISHYRNDLNNKQCPWGKQKTTKNCFKNT